MKRQLQKTRSSFHTKISRCAQSLFSGTLALGAFDGKRCKRALSSPVRFDWGLPRPRQAVLSRGRSITAPQLCHSPLLSLFSSAPSNKSIFLLSPCSACRSHRHRACHLAALSQAVEQNFDSFKQSCSCKNRSAIRHGHHKHTKEHPRRHPFAAPHYSHHLVLCIPFTSADFGHKRFGLHSTKANLLKQCPSDTHDFGW